MGGGGTEDIAALCFAFCGIESVAISLQEERLDVFFVQVETTVAAIAQPTNEQALVSRKLGLQNIVFSETNETKITSKSSQWGLRGSFQRLSQDELSVELESMRAREGNPCWRYKMSIQNKNLQSTTRLSNTLAL